MKHKIEEQRKNTKRNEGRRSYSGSRKSENEIVGKTRGGAFASKADNNQEHPLSELLKRLLFKISCLVAQEINTTEIIKYRDNFMTLICL